MLVATPLRQGIVSLDLDLVGEAFFFGYTYLEICFHLDELVVEEGKGWSWWWLFTQD